jgi:hypothetical protein
LSCTHRATQEGAFPNKALIKLPAIGQLKKELFLSPDEAFSSCGDPHNKYRATMKPIAYWFWVLSFSFYIFCLRRPNKARFSDGIAGPRIWFVFE